MSLLGVDLSEWNGTPNFDALVGQVDFVLARSSFGTLRADYQYSRNINEARRVGLARGSYHYAYPQYNSPQDEANFFVDIVGGIEPGEILALDFEESYADPANWSLQFLQTVENRVGFKPLIYMNLSLTRSANWGAVKDYGLWLAEWNGIQASSDTPWDVVAMHQFTNNGNLSGVQGRVDLSYFFGDVNNFRAYGKPLPTPAPVPSPTPEPTPPPPPTPIPAPPDTPPPPAPIPLPVPPPDPHPVPPGNEAPTFISLIIAFLVALGRALRIIK